MAIIKADGAEFGSPTQAGVVTCRQPTSTTLGKLGALVINSSNTAAFIEIVNTTNNNRAGFLRFSGTDVIVPGDLTAFNTTIPSDIKLKENIKDIENPLEKVLSIRGVTFNHKKSENKKLQLGVIAQEIEKVIPELITESSDPSDVTGEEKVKTVSYIQLIPLLIEAIKEQNKIINDLTHRIQILENQ